MRSFVYKILWIRRISVCIDADSLRNAKNENAIEPKNEKRNIYIKYQLDFKADAVITLNCQRTNKKNYLILEAIVRQIHFSVV